MTPNTHSISYDRVREVLTYNPRSGKCYWNVHPWKTRVGAEAGTFEDVPNRSIRFRKDGTAFDNPAPRYKIVIDGVSHYLHNVIWLWMLGEYPPRDWGGDIVDHKDHNSANNKWRNLRRLTRSQNKLYASPKRPREVSTVCI